jgi:hypothetical protein
MHSYSVKQVACTKIPVVEIQVISESMKEAVDSHLITGMLTIILRI